MIERKMKLTAQFSSELKAGVNKIVDIDENNFVTTSFDNSIHFWSISKNKCVNIINKKYEVSDLITLKDKKNIVIASELGNLIEVLNL
jgi:hypothetical protein